MRYRESMSGQPQWGNPFGAFKELPREREVWGGSRGVGDSAGSREEEGRRRERRGWKVCLATGGLWTLFWKERMATEQSEQRAL